MRPQYVVVWVKKWDKKAGIFGQKERTPQYVVVSLLYKGVYGIRLERDIRLNSPTFRFDRLESSSYQCFIFFGHRGIDMDGNST